MRQLLVLALILLAGCAKAPAVLDLNRLGDEVFRLTNAMRAEQKLPPLERGDSLDRVSEFHSRNMAEKNFFDHQDPDGLSPDQRLDKYLPQLLCANSGENIVLRSVEGDEAKMAQILLELWRKSPEHYAHIVSPDFRHLGVGVFQQEDKLWATQTFASAIAKLESPTLPLKVNAGANVILQFHFLADFPGGELTAFLTAPDPRARIPAGNGSAYVGKGPVRLDWSDDTHFSLTIPASYGLGTYRIKLGRGSAYYDKAFEFEARPTI